MLIGRLLAYKPAIHVVNPSMKARRILYIFNPPIGDINICSVIWQISIYIEAICLLVVALSPLKFNFRVVLSYLVTAQWVGLGSLTMIYGLISMFILPRK